MTLCVLKYYKSCSSIFKVIRRTIFSVVLTYIRSIVNLECWFQVYTTAKWLDFLNYTPFKLYCIVDYSSYLFIILGLPYFITGRVYLLSFICIDIPSLTTSGNHYLSVCLFFCFFNIYLNNTLETSGTYKFNNSTWFDCEKPCLKCR